MKSVRTQVVAGWKYYLTVEATEQGEVSPLTDISLTSLHCYDEATHLVAFSLGHVGASRKSSDDTPR